jgi:hypothetical protein
MKRVKRPLPDKEAAFMGYKLQDTRVWINDLSTHVSWLWNQRIYHHIFQHRQCETHSFHHTMQPTVLEKQGWEEETKLLIGFDMPFP